MKEALTHALLKAARSDPSLMLLTGDLGYGAFDSFAKECASQFLNCGVAEQNMVGVAAGLAAEGRRPVVYSIGNFLVFRAAEQIRNDVVAAGRPVLLVAAGGGFTYGAAGFSHHLTEDLAFMRSMSTVDVFTPALNFDVGPMVADWLDCSRPVYLRLDRSTDSQGLNAPNFERGKWRLVREGEQVALFSIGSALTVALQVADGLRSRGIYARVTDCNQLTSLSVDGVDRALTGISTAATFEEHSTRGGLGSVVAEEITSRGAPIRLHRFGLDGPHSKLAGSPSYLRSQHGLDANLITDRIVSQLCTPP